MGKLGEEEEIETERRREHTDLGLDLGKREEHVSCHASAFALAMTDGACRSGSADVSLTIFITSVRGSKGLTSFTNRFFHFSGPPGFRLAFDAAEGNDIWSHSVPEM